MPGIEFDPALNDSKTCFHGFGYEDCNGGLPEDHPKRLREGFIFLDCIKAHKMDIVQIVHISSYYWIVKRPLKWK